VVAVGGSAHGAELVGRAVAEEAGNAERSASPKIERKYCYEAPVTTSAGRK
jgi:hypothetical protein